MSFFNVKNKNTSASRWCSGRGASQKTEHQSWWDQLGVRSSSWIIHLHDCPTSAKLHSSRYEEALWKKFLFYRIPPQMDAPVLLIPGVVCVVVLLLWAERLSGSRDSLWPSALFGKQALVFKVHIYGFFSALRFGLLKSWRALWWIYRDDVELSCIMQIKEEQAGNVYACELKPCFVLIPGGFFQGEHVLSHQCGSVRCSSPEIHWNQSVGFHIFDFCLGVT